MKNITVDYLIIGQGIAGSLFANKLIDEKKSFFVFDSGLSSSTKVACGMYNPVVLKRFSPVWNAEKQIIKAIEVFSSIEKRLNTRLVFPCDVFRIFDNTSEKNLWQSKSEKKELNKFLDKKDHFIDNLKIKNPLGAGKVNHAGIIYLREFLREFNSYLPNNNLINYDIFDYDELKQENGLFKYQNITANKVIFCEGYTATENPYFNYLPLKGNKGEVMIIRSQDLKLQKVIKSKSFIMPMKGCTAPTNTYYIGATYNWDDKDEIPTEEAKKELQQKLESFCSAKYTVIKQFAGMRPTVIDRRPLIGEHPKYKNMYILNGLGTRGVMLGATMADELYAFSEYNKELTAEVNINRFYNLYVECNSI